MLLPICIAVGNFQKCLGPSIITQWMRRVNHVGFNGVGLLKKASVPFTILSHAKRTVLITRISSTTTVFGRWVDTVISIR